MFLITTAVREFWNSDENILFLGEWCKKPSAFNTWRHLNYEILPYHWQNRKKYLEDAQKLDDLYERYLPVIAHRLNEIHNEDHSIMYWRIILGPWLYYFVGIIFDRFLSINAAKKSGLVEHTWLPSFSRDAIVPVDFGALQSLVTDDAYNLYIYSWLIQHLGGIPYETKELPFLRERGGVHAISLDWKKRFRSRIALLYNVYSRIFPRSFNNIFFASLNFRAIDLFRLQISLRQFPEAQTPNVDVHNCEENSFQRGIIKLDGGDITNEFDGVFSAIVGQQIPKSYLEHYQKFKTVSAEVFPKRSKVIISSNAHFFNEGFKIWSAAQVEKGARLVGMPHGGHYGNAKWSANERHERKVSDGYLSWGWKDINDARVIPLSSLQLAKSKILIKVNRKGGFLWIGLSRPRYFSWMISAPTQSDMPAYISDQITFLDALGPDARENLTLRLFHSDYGWGIKSTLLENFPNLCFSPKEVSMYNELCENRLCIVTYNATPLLETLSANYPTIGFWDSNHWEIRDSAIPFFQEMREAGIFHADPTSAAAKIKEISSDISAWWKSSDVMKARRSFCKEFARTGQNGLKEWKEEVSRLRLN